MPEYRRFVAYFYEYIDGKKQKNAGFAKVELRNGVWRIQFRLTVPTLLQAPVQVSGFVREKNRLLSCPMGNMRAGRGGMEERAYRAGETVWQGKYGLADISGIWITSGDGRFFLTVWDEMSVDSELLRRAGRESDREEESSAAEIVAAELNADAEPEAAETEEVRVLAEPEAVEAAAETETEEPLVMSGADEIEAAAETDMSAEPEFAETEAEELRVPAEWEAAEITEETEEEELRVPAESDAVETTEETEEEELCVPAEWEAAEITEETEEEEPRALAEPQREQKLLQAELLEQRRENRERRNRKLWMDIYQRRTDFHPFADREISCCIRVSPDDVARLHAVGWRTGRNSFLLHGYYQYRHLVIGKTADDTYILGVPGIMNPQEKYMAGMFGFPYFKYADSQECEPAFGYWYRILEQEPLETN